jgi:DNA-directed RNA polymerase specialized sigma24 family protein
MVVRDISVGRRGVEQLTCHQVLVALDALPAPQGRAIVAVSAGHRAYRDAAELLGDSEENTSSQIRSGLSRLATIFGHATNVGPS